MGHRTVVIRLELHLTDDSMTGRASDGTGEAKAFVGRLGLMAAIDALLPGASPLPAPLATRDDGAPA